MQELSEGTLVKCELFVNCHGFKLWLVDSIILAIVLCQIHEELSS